MKVEMTLKTGAGECNPSKFMEPIHKLVSLGWQFEGANGHSTKEGAVHTASLTKIL